MYITVPKLTPLQINEILKVLPEPNNATVIIFGNFDFSSVFEQVNSLVPGIELSRKGAEEFYWKNPSKKLLLKLVLGPLSVQFKEVNWYIKEFVNLEIKDSKEYNINSIDFTNVSEAQTVIKLNPWSIDVSYQGEKPFIVDKLRSIEGVECNVTTIKKIEQNGTFTTNSTSVSL